MPFKKSSANLYKGVLVRCITPDKRSIHIFFLFPRNIMFLWRNKKNISTFQLKKSALSGAMQVDIVPQAFPEINMEIPRKGHNHGTQSSQSTGEGLNDIK